jgi:hypothetical protein
MNAPNPDALRQIAESRELVEACAERGLSLRLLGGAAIAMHSGREDAPHRTFSDLDTVVVRREVRSITKLFLERGYEADKRFNTLNADTRLIFYGPAGKLDVFIDDFEMCHRIPLAGRISVDNPTLSPTDLLLTKLQVVEINQKDVDDLVLLIEAHAVSGGEGDHFNADYLRRILGRDWGLWKTVTMSIGKLRDQAPQLRDRLDELGQVAASAPRSLGFRLRGILGERSRWYEEPEEVGDDH